MRIPKLVLRLSLFLLLVESPFAAAGGDHPRAVTFDDAPTLGFAGRIPLSVSADGRWLAFTLVDSSRRQSAGDTRFLHFSPTGASTEVPGCDVWIADLHASGAKNLTGGRGTSWGPVWSPDGQSLAFCSDRDGQARLWVWNRNSNSLRRVSDVIVRPFFGFEVARWTPDSKQILMKVLPEGFTLDSAADLIAGPPPKEGAADRSGKSTVAVYRSFPVKDKQAAQESKEKPSFVNVYRADLALIDVTKGQVRRVAQNVMPLGFWIAPDCKHAAFTDFRGMDRLQLLFDLVVVDLPDGSCHTVATRQPMKYGISFSWSPNSDRLAFITAVQPDKGDCFVADTSKAEPVLCTKGTHHTFYTEHAAPLWDSEGRSFYCLSDGEVWRVEVTGKTTRVTKDWKKEALVILAREPGQFWSPDGGRSLVVITRDKESKSFGFYRVELETGEAAQLWEGNVRFHYNLEFNYQVTPDGRQIVYAAEDATHPTDLWVAETPFNRPRRLTQVNPQPEHNAFVNSRRISWRGIDGDTLGGMLVLPANYQEGRRYPLVVSVYGGSTPSNNAYQFAGKGGLATHGYAVLRPDTPLHVGSPMSDLLKTVMPGVDKVIELGIADPDRLGVMGHSYGGYSTLALICQTRRFKAAIASDGISDLLSFYGTMEKNGSSVWIGWSEEGQGHMGGTPWQFMQRYLENSPIYYLDRISTPLLLVHGALDEAVPPAQSEQVFVGLRRLGKEVVYARYEGEGHSPAYWGHANQVDYEARILEWFDTHIGEKAPPHSHPVSPAQVRTR
jgi:dipeptidyl aminopeptidase/acylaminoacyl peptidase